MDGVKQEVSYGDGSGKCHKSALLGNSGIDPSTPTKKLKMPQVPPVLDDSSLKKAKKTIGRFFYEMGLDFNAVYSPSFQSMIFSFAGGVKYQIPTCQELNGWIFNEAVKEMHEYVNGIRSSWADTGCSVLLDEWTDEQGRNLVNVLVDCPRGTVYLRSEDISDYIGNMDAMHMFLDKVMAEVGIANVVQIMVCSTSAFMKEVGKELMEKYRPIFWTFSTSSCIELMLEKLCKMNLINGTLEKAKTITRFVHMHSDAFKFVQNRTNGGNLVKCSKIQLTQLFLTLENIVLEKETLKAMFHLNKALTSTEEGKSAAELVANRSFWSDTTNVLNGAIPLVRVIQWLHASTSEQMGYIYETIDQAKETIKDGFKKKSQYEQFWKVIDNIWDEFLYSPLHSAGYFLNPSLFYSEDVYIDPEVAIGMLCCIVRWSTDLHIQDQIVIQMEKYRTAKGSFGTGSTVDARSKVSPVQWWCKYGAECPELQRLAVRILSQTCDGASKFQLKRSLAEALLLRGRNQEEHKRLSESVFLQYNIQLQNFMSGKTDYIASGSTDAMDDWIAGKIHSGTITT